jgi:hypothetical protein
MPKICRTGEALLLFADLCHAANFRLSGEAQRYVLLESWLKSI